ncbi:MAG: RHS repeat-associated core domain-containing protein [Minisyncoccia bacterium]
MQTIDYYPYGDIRQNTKATSFDIQRKYIGEYYDDTAQLSYLNARYYNPSTGQFVSEDPVFWWQSQNLANPQSLNSYSYAGNNPIGSKDPSGLFTISGTAKNTGGSIWGTGAGTLSLISNVYNNGASSTMQAVGRQISNSVQSIGTGQGSQTTQNFFFGTDAEQDAILGGILGDTAVGLATGVAGKGSSSAGRFSATNGKTIKNATMGAKTEFAGLGSTGRTVANSLEEKLSMEEVMSNPMSGKKIMSELKDGRWQGWDKYSYSREYSGSGGGKVEIHFNGLNVNGIFKVDDFKFINN